MSMDWPVVKFRRLSEAAQMPVRATAAAAAYDLFSTQDCYLSVWKTRQMVSTGIGIQLPPNHVALVCSRSGLAHKEGIFVVNSPGVIDEDYTGEIKVVLGWQDKSLYFSDGEYRHLPVGSRIAQLLILPRPQVNVQEVEDFIPTGRGDAGFGSTGVHTYAC